MLNLHLDTGVPTGTVIYISIQVYQPVLSFVCMLPEEGFNYNL